MQICTHFDILRHYKIKKESYQPYKVDKMEIKGN